MSTIDKLVLEVKAEGANKFVQDLNEINDSLNKVQKNIKSSTGDIGSLDKKKTESERKSSKIDKKKNKQSELEKKNSGLSLKTSKAFNQMLKQTNKEFSKISNSLVSIGLSYLGVKGIKSLLERSESSSKNSTALDNQARAANLPTEQLESIQTTLKGIGESENLLTPLLGKISAEQGFFNGNGSAGDEEILTLASHIRGMTGDVINFKQDDTLKVLDQIAKSIQKLSTDKIQVLAQRTGVSPQILSALSNKDYFKARKVGDETARLNAKNLAKNQDTNLFNTELDKKINNQLNNMADNLSGVNIALKQFELGMINSINEILKSISDQTFTGSGRDVKFKDEEKFIKYGIAKPKPDNYQYNDQESLLQNFFKKKNIPESRKEAFKKLDDDILSTDTRVNTVYLKNHVKYIKGSLNLFKNYNERDYYDYILEEAKKREQTPSTQNKRLLIDTPQTKNIVNEKTNEITKDFNRNIVNESNKNLVNEVSKDFTKNIVNEKNNEISNEFTKELVSQDKIKEITGDQLNINPENIKQHNIDAQYRNNQYSNGVSNIDNSVNVNEVILSNTPINSLEQLGNEIRQKATTTMGLNSADVFTALSNTR